MKRLDVEKFVIEKIQSSPKNVTKSQKLVADFLIKNFKKATYMTAKQIGSEAGVSETTVIRFALSLGYKRFSELQDEFREEIFRDRTVQRLRQANEKTEKNNVITASMEQDIKNIQQTLSNVKEDDFESVVQLICEAKNIYVIGFRSSSSDAFYLSFSLAAMLNNVKTVTNIGSDLDECLKNANENSVIITFSYPRYTTFSLDSVLYLKEEKQAKIIAITDSVQSPIIPFSDYVLLTSIDSLTPKDSHVASLALSNAIISSVGRNDQKRVEENLNNLENYLKKVSIFHQ